MHHLNIAIDGPAGAGKSTVAKEVARQLGLLYVDTGAMYRSVAWLSRKYAIPVADEDAIIAVLRQHPLQFTKSAEGTLDAFADGECITPFLRDPDVSNRVSPLSVHPQVRALLTNWQREFGTKYSVVMDGRDIGTVVLPAADVKVFLTASLDERTKRRANEFSEKGFSVSETELKKSIQERDDRDSSRAVAPLRPAADAHCIDSTGKTVQQVVDEILALVERSQV